MRKKIASIAMIGLSAVALASCSGSNKGYNNEIDSLNLSIQEVDKVFNPFFSSSASDSTVVGLTQIAMLGNDKNGNVTYGDDHAVVVLDMDTTTNGLEDDELETTYTFVLKNNVKFSNGSPLTIKDVLFNLYVYLDPVYTGSSTIYSTDIVGLQEYRTNSASQREQDRFLLQFQTEAQTRIFSLIDAAEMINKEYKDTSLSMEDFREEIKAYGDETLADFDKACELFKEEIENDYNNFRDSASSYTFTAANGTIYSSGNNNNLLTTDVEAFLYNEGYISWNKKEGKLASSFGDPKELKLWTKEKAIETVIGDMLPKKIGEVVSYWNTSNTLNEFLVNDAMENYFKTLDRTYKNIEGIKFANYTEPVTVNGVEYDVPQYEADGSVKKGSNEVLSITIHKVDPKAIYNFGFAVAPMYYYSDKEHIEMFDYEENFGVEYGSQSFMNNVVKAPSKIGVPVGAGAYAASKESGGLENVKAGDFCTGSNIIYFERNPYFLLGKPTIKKIRFQVVPNQQMLNKLYTSQIDFIEPNAKPEIIQQLDQKSKDGIGYKQITTAGYGYIGVNAAKVPDLEVRQVIMHSINTLDIVSYYGNTAKSLYRPLSLTSWVYDKSPTLASYNSYYPYLGAPIPDDLTNVNPAYREYVEGLGLSSGQTMTEAQQIAFVRSMVEDTAGYTLNGNGVYVKSGHTLKYTFTIAGQETDHPAWTAMFNAGNFLNKCGFNITVKTDANALSKLTTGALDVWAAAWSSTIDPDMYQVYHMDSTATATKNWGYNAILNNTDKYSREYELLNDLATLIEEGRETLDQDVRAMKYTEALNLVMQLAVELPTYQRKDLSAYSTKKIDEMTMPSDDELSPYTGILSKIWDISLNEER